MTDLIVSIPADDISLAGTLTVPDGEGPFPTVLLLTGSGELDRDGDHKRMALSISRQLAESLTQNGWASLRYDKRGVGESSGDYLSTGLYDELADATTALHWLQSQTTTAYVVVVGHSLGALFAVEMSAVEPDLKGAVLLCHTIRTGDETLKWQAANMAESIPRLGQLIFKMFGTSFEKLQEKSTRKMKATTGDTARVQFQKINAKWLRELMAYDPEPAMATANGPMLAITGSKDVQVNPDDLAEMDSIAGRRIETHLIPDLDHTLRREDAETSSPARYRKQTQKPIDERVTSILTTWLASLTVETGETSPIE